MRLNIRRPQREKRDSHTQRHRDTTSGALSIVIAFALLDRVGCVSPSRGPA